MEVNNKPVNSRPIHFTELDISPAGIENAYQQIRDLDSGGQKLQARDEVLLGYLFTIRTLGLDQIQRLLWPAQPSETVRRRMTKLVKYGLLAYARQPADLAEWDLQQRCIYALGLAGRFIQQSGEELTPAMISRHTNPDYVLLDTLLAEVFVHLDQSVLYRGSDWTYRCDIFESVKDLKKFTSVALVVVRHREQPRLTAFIQICARDKSLKGEDWSWLVAVYDELYVTGRWRDCSDLSAVDEYPQVLLCFRNEELLNRAAQEIIQRRKQPVSYLLALWDDIRYSSDLLTMPVRRIDEATEERPLIELEPAMPPPIEQYSRKTHTKLKKAAERSGISSLVTLNSQEAPKAEIARLLAKIKARMPRYFWHFSLDDEIDEPLESGFS